MSTGALESPRRLVRQDVTAGFRSGATELDDWFQRYAWQNQKANNAVVYVTAQDDVILGYYAITTASYSRDDAPQGLNHRSRPEEILCILLARLAVDERAQGRGVGAALLKDAIERCYRLSREVAPPPSSCTAETSRRAPSTSPTATFFPHRPTPCTCCCP